jgi:hypothetical protein
VLRRAFILLAITAAFASGAAALAHPTVTVTSMRPVTVAGRGFLRGEHVRVVVYSKRNVTKYVVASRRGRFVLRYPIAVGDCSGVHVVARGSRGSRASYSLTTTCDVSRR